MGGTTPPRYNPHPSLWAWPDLIPPAIPSADNVQNHETQRTTEKPIGAERRKPHKPPIIDNTEYSLQLRK